MKRLRDETSSEFVKSLLDSAAADAPAAGAEERTLRVAERELFIPKAWPRAWAFGGAVVGIGALLLLLGHAYQLGTPTPPPKASAPASLTAPPPPTSAPAPSSPAPTEAVTAASASAAANASVTVAPTHAPSVATSAAPPPSASAGPLGLRDELALLDEARSELATGNASASLATLDRYDGRYPSGMLREEALAVRVEALFAAGRAAEGRRVGERFLSEHPQSTHAQHVRSLLGRDEPRDDAHAP